MSESPEICFINRKPNEYVSIERVFEQVSSSLTGQGVKTKITALKYGSSALGILLNLLLFKAPKADVFHVTGHTHFICLRLPPTKTVLTIHDLRFLKRGEGLRAWLLRKLFLDWPVRRVHAVTAVSEATREAILKETGCDPGKVHVIPNPLRCEFIETSHAGSGSSTPVILQMGTMENKNLPALLQAVKEENCRLHIVGRLSDEQRAALHRDEVQYINDVSLSADRVVEAYAKADVLAFCSTLEGFGLPIIEAQAVGLPVVTSDASPMREVAGAGASLADPSDPKDIRRAIFTLLNDSELQTRLVSEGKKNVERYKADEIAKAYRGIYKSMIES